MFQIENKIGESMKEEITLNELDGLCQDCFRYPKVQDKIKEYEQYFDSDMEIRTKLITRIEQKDNYINSLLQYTKDLEEQLQQRDNIIKEAIDYVEHISNVDIDWHEQDRIVNILRRIDKDE